MIVLASLFAAATVAVAAATVTAAASASAQNQNMPNPVSSQSRLCRTGGPNKGGPCLDSRAVSYTVKSSQVYAITYTLT